jgi:hypothetical protein
MAKRKRETTQAVIDRRIREGRGQGTGADYRPWLFVQDVPSRGLTHRIKGWKTGRVHHLFSNHERDYFYLLDWSLVVQDIREQFPLLPVEETVEIAKECGIRHPINPRTQQPVVMTTDFLVTVTVEGHTADQARAIKPVCHLSQARVLEKLELERRYWQNRHIDWGIVTARETPRAVTDNVRLLHSYYRLEDRLFSRNEVDLIASVLAQRIRAQSDTPLRQLTADCDQQLGFKPGTSLAVTYHLLATRQWRVNMNVPIDPNAPLFLSEAIVEREADPC